MQHAFNLSLQPLDFVLEQQTEDEEQADLKEPGILKLVQFLEVGSVPDDCGAIVAGWAGYCAC